MCNTFIFHSFIHSFCLVLWVDQDLSVGFQTNGSSGFTGSGCQSEFGLTAPVLQSWTQTHVLVILAGTETLSDLVLAVLGRWTLLDRTFVEISQMGLAVALTGHRTLRNLMAGNLNLDAAVSAAPLHCGLT